MLSALTRLLPMAEKVVDRRTSLPILKEICIQDGLARVTDLETMLVMPVPEVRAYTIPVALLKKVLATRPQNLFVSVGEDQKVTISYGDQKVTYSSRNTDEFPALPREKFKPIGEWSRDIFQVLVTQARYCSRDELKASLTGVFITQEKGQLAASATDGHVLRMQNGLDVGKAKPLSGIIPTKPLLLLAKLARGHTKIGLSNTHLSFSLPGDVSLYVRLIDEKYPEVESVVPKEFSGEVILDRDKVLSLIKAAKPFVDRTTYLSIWNLQNGDGQIIVDNLEDDISWQAPLPVSNSSGEGIRVGFDLGLFERTLASQQSPTVRWKYTAPGTASVFTEVGKEWDSGAVTLLMPIRITEEEVNHEQERGD